jgi:hypothetical protein
MRVSNDLLINAESMGASVTSAPVYVEHLPLVLLQAVWTGTPVGNFTVQYSADVGTDSAGTGVTNWTTDSDSTIAAGGAAGDLAYDIETSAKWVRLVYTRTSGTGTLSARFNAKGA